MTKREAIKLILIVALPFVLLFGGKHLIDTDFWQHPSTDELDIFK